MCKAMEEIKKRERTMGLKKGREEGLEEGIEKGIKKGIEKGRVEGREEGVEALIEAMHELDQPRESIVKQVEKRFSLTRDEAENAVERYLD